MNAKIAIVDDHSLLRKGLVTLIEGFDSFTVVLEAGNGNEFIQKLNPANLPDIVLLDINMPGKNGYDTAKWIQETYPDMKFLALSMVDQDLAIIRMLRYGAKGYILKDSDPYELHAALKAVLKKGFYYSELVTGSLIHSINGNNDHHGKDSPILSDRELQFLKFACSELTYKEIADRMFLSPRTIDGYREALFEKLSVKTRVGLVMYAIKNSIVELSPVSTD